MCRGAYDKEYANQPAAIAAAASSTATNGHTRRQRRLPVVLADAETSVAVAMRLPPLPKLLARLTVSIVRLRAADQPRRASGTQWAA
ncbi:hypothetical protein GCM10009872_09330 [Actinopolymorpha rutila]